LSYGTRRYTGASSGRKVSRGGMSTSSLTNLFVSISVYTIVDNLHGCA
jgi:hypothetical protein